MKLKPYLFSILAVILITIGCSKENVIENRVKLAAQQVELMVAQMDTMSDIKSPRTLDKEGNIRYVPLDEWTSGFFPGSLWYLYELTGDAKWLDSATKYTEGMEHIKYYTGNHDIGFMIFCSFGNGLRLTGKEYYEDVIVTAAQTLIKRYRSGAGVIQSWNTNKKWDCPVIIDNMMNLELLFEATGFSGDSTYWNIAVSHADQTLKHHFREDYSSYHVVDYDTINNTIRAKNTHQGYDDESSWSRGQGWGLYGYTMCYRYTNDERYLRQAEKIADYIFNHQNLPEDLIPYWDYNAPKPSEGKYAERLRVENPRDVSAASLSASALYELSTYVEGGQKYKELADKILESLSSPIYSAELGKNGNFVLMHSTGSVPHKSEIDVPLVYADYYYFEALKRKKDLEIK